MHVHGDVILQIWGEENKKKKDDSGHCLYILLLLLFLSVAITFFFSCSFITFLEVLFFFFCFNRILSAHYLSTLFCLFVLFVSRVK